MDGVVIANASAIAVVSGVDTPTSPQLQQQQLVVDDSSRPYSPKSVTDTLLIHDEQPRLQMVDDAMMEKTQQQQLRFHQDLIQQLQQYQLLQQQEHTVVHKRPRPGTERRVRFAEEACLYSSDRTEEDVHICWYTGDELATFKKDRKNIVRLLKRCNFDLELFETHDHCLRGYEPYFSIEMNKAMKEARDHVFASVLWEQHRQRIEGYFNDQAIAECSMMASRWAKQNALQLGQNDAMESLFYYQHDRN